MPADTSSNPNEETHVFHADLRGAARNMLLLMCGVLAIILESCWRVYQGAALEPDRLGGLIAVLVVFGGLSEILVYRAKDPRPVLIVGPMGVSLPRLHSEDMDWSHIRSIEVSTLRGGKGARMKVLRFQFHVNTLRRAQLGTFRRDRFELIVETRGLFGWTPMLSGGRCGLFDSVERFRPIMGARAAL